MGWTQASDYIEEQWVRPSRVVTVKKQVWDVDQQQFVTRLFYRVACRTSTEFEESYCWLETTYGAPRLQGTWWTTGNRQIWMTESLISFWLLKHPEN